MMVPRKVLFSVAVCLFVGSGLVLGGVLHDANYWLETFSVYTHPVLKAPTHMAFDGDGNLYTTHFVDAHAQDGVIYRINPDGTAERWVENLYRPLGIVWGGGTAFGDYLYVCDGSNFDNWERGEITRIAPSGTVTPFAGDGFNHPGALGLDRTGNYGGLLYVGNTSYDRFLSVAPNGTTSEFSPFPGHYYGTPGGVAFDESGVYGGRMYVGMAYPNHPSLTGLFWFDADGNEQRFSAELQHTFSLAFDNTAQQWFDGMLFAEGFVPGSGSWHHVYRVAADGSLTLFYESTTHTDTPFAFGPDGALYIAEYFQDTNEVVISRVVPEPLTGLLLLAGAAGLRRRRA